MNFRTSMRLTVGAMLAITHLLSGTLAVADGGDQVPFLRCEENQGHLAFKSCLPAGRGDFSTNDPGGLLLQGFVYIAGETDGTEKQPRLFRLRGSLGESSHGQGEKPAAPEFFINLQATANPHHYVLHIKTTLTIDGKPVQEEARLGRNCCGYYVTATRNGTLLPIGRGRLLTDIMVQAADTYRRFEQLAQVCCRPGFEFVPRSPFSPSVVQEVIAADQAAPAVHAKARFELLVAELDSEQFARREAASAELIRGGRSTVALLDQLGQQRLSAEQRHRLHDIQGVLKEYSELKLPFAFTTQAIREMTDAPPKDWLSQLCQSSEPLVSDWARRKSALLSRSTPRPEEPASTTGREN